tara:strand:+ start:67 stop:939 length:873 start_codon:yes stop_codon:yes gene_type:complete
MDENEKSLNTYLIDSYKNMSNFGKTLIFKSNFTDISSLMNNGSFVHLNWKRRIKSFLSIIPQYIIFKNAIFNNPFIKKYRIICFKQKRVFNIDFIIHSIFLEILQQRNILSGNVCVIGDGSTYFLSGVFDEKKIGKIYSVNLPQSLIQDYLIIKKTNLIDTKLIKVVNNKDDLLDKNIKLFLIPAKNKDLLLKHNINLFVNAFSFQEMPLEETKRYLEIVESNSAYIYSINREEKDMLDGNIIKYKDYGFKENKIIFHEEAKFVEKFYNSSFPFVHQKEKKVLHTLALLN